MPDDVYVKSIEDENERLKQKLAESQLYLDRVEDNPLEESLTLLIGASIKHQKKTLTKRGFHRNSELCELKLGLPRQIGLSTSIVNAAAKFFTEVDVLHVPSHRFTTANSLVGSCIVYHHATVNNFIHRQVSCVIVDPWSVMYDRREQDWQDIKDKIMSRIDMSNPYLLIMAG
jgi:hypothetical protein